jgi:hypothetical protein
MATKGIEATMLLVPAMLIIYAVTYLGLNDLQIPHLNTGCCKIRNLKLDVDGPLALASANATHTSTETSHHAATLLVVSSYRRQSELGAHEEFLAATKLLNLPYYR